jgi:hypothetical protein
MSDIPDFKTLEDETLFYDIYDEKLVQYKFMLDKVRELLFDGKGSGSYMNVPGSMLDVMHRICRDIIYEATQRFEKERPEYKDAYDGMFIHRNDLQETVKIAVSEAQQQILLDNNDNLRN